MIEFEATLIADGLTLKAALIRMFCPAVKLTLGARFDVDAVEPKAND